MMEPPVLFFDASNDTFYTYMIVDLAVSFAHYLVANIRGNGVNETGDVILPYIPSFSLDFADGQFVP